MGKQKINKIAPVLMSYIVMGFVDIVGVSTGYAQRDFDLSPEVAQLIPSMVFIWFFLLSIPVGIFQNNFGKRKILLAGIFTTAIGMFIPFVHYTYPTLLLCFLLLGIGNTIIQVSSNPLLQDVVNRNKFSSFMSLSQFIKAISSLVGPLIVTFMVASYGDWKLVFLVYGFISIFSGSWLILTGIDETQSEFKASFKTSLSLLKNPFVASMVVAIFLIVGLDVGMNTSIQNLLVQKFEVGLERASLGISVYFFALMTSRFLGALILAKVDNLKFLYWTTISTIFCIVLLIVAPNSLVALVLIFLIGLSSGNLFPLVFSLTIGKLPNRANEISGLMIMAVVGGAVIPPLMGLVNRMAGVSISFIVLLLCAVYVYFTYHLFKKFKN
ncbi:sugar transporter [Salegentibacter salinarum]|uniref:Sugar transporter n=1 Tax=Salegentibacter salinarum TaxID=447422 RepID=A0A2N0U0I8_9FLAO|nr:MFS transporter [Salegentibacter salinarum]PKD20398.1 sugar transporter [Salegentibacter salinarum]SKB85227.1 Fucose permease [Salegentibacter salinarum]